MDKTSQKAFWRNWLLNRKRKLDWKALLVCVAIAFTLWLIGALSNESSLELHFTLLPMELNEACEVDNNFPLEINVTVQSKGFDLLNRWFQSTNTPIDLPLDKFPCKSGSIQISSDQLKALVLPHLNDGLSISKMSPEVLEISLLKKAIRKLPVEPDFNVTAPPGYRFTNKFVVTPDSIPIEGSSEVIDQIKSVKTIEYQVFELNTTEATLIIPEGLSTSINSVSVLPVFDTLLSRYVSLRPSININVSPENTSFFPPTIDVQIIGTPMEIEQVKLDNLKLKSIIDPDHPNRAKLTLEYHGALPLQFVLDKEYIQFLAIE